MWEFKKIYFLIPYYTIVFTLGLYLIPTLSISPKIRYIVSNETKTDFKNYFNFTVYEYQNVTLLSIEKNEFQIFVARITIENITIIDVHAYKHKGDDFQATDEGFIFKENYYVYKDIIRFIYGTEIKKVIYTDQGYLYLNKIIIDKSNYVYMKMRKRSNMAICYRGIMMTYQESLKFAGILERYEDKSV